jgi:hypothetical protein
MNALSRLLHIDRRWIFLCIAAAVLVPLALNLKLLQPAPMPATLAVYDTIEKLPAGRPVMLMFDYGPAGMPEIQPMAQALIRHCFQRKLPVIAMTLNPQGVPMAEKAFAKVSPDFDVRYGRDYVNLGFKPGGLSVVLGLGSGFAVVYPSDVRGTPLSQLPIMREVKDYSSLGLAVDLATGSAPGTWVAYAHQRFRLPLALGITAVMATDNYVYLQTGQIVGLLNGMRGAAEYENLVKHPDTGVSGMSSQSVAHLVIILFVILGNIGYFAGRAHARRRGEV